MRRTSIVKPSFKKIFMLRLIACLLLSSVSALKNLVSFTQRLGRPLISARVSSE